ncbi:TIM barrel protein [Reichenbachiella sp. MALMAid0571]|uniref:TIM barrel protein n=1 Tax=Reichenbachiella sp. MALMAid0571 TaxID=3143939 RepID=UPI0032DF9EBF
MPLAEKNKVSMVLEPLNSIVTENMKGHSGYQGNHLEICMEIIKLVSSPAFRLFFDVYHIQIMDGNIIDNIKKYMEYIGHVQVAEARIVEKLTVNKK